MPVAPQHEKSSFEFLSVELIFVQRASNAGSLRCRIFVFW